MFFYKMHCKLGYLSVNLTRFLLFAPRLTAYNLRPYSNNTKQLGKIFSTIYISKLYADKLYPVVAPKINLYQLQSNWNAEVNYWKERTNSLNLPPDFTNTFKDFLELKSALEKSALEVKSLKKTLFDLKAKGTQDISQLENQYLELKKTTDAKWSDFHNLEKVVLPIILQIPNRTHKRTESQRLVLHSVNVSKNEEQVFKSHSEIGKFNGSIIFSNVGPGTYYLQGKTALLETFLLEYFENAMNKKGFYPTSNPHIVKSVMVEGCGSNPFSKQSSLHIKWKPAKIGNTLHLCGSTSLESLAAYFAKTCLSQEELPIKIYSTGRRYSMESFLAKSQRNLYRVVQQNEVGFFGCCQEESQALSLLDETVELLKKKYAAFEIPFRIVQATASELEPSESLRVEVEIWSPVENKFYSCAHVSLYGDYLSKRLNMYQSDEKSKISLLHCFGGRSVSTSTLIAGIVENLQNNELDYKLPTELLKEFN